MHKMVISGIIDSNQHKNVIVHHKQQPKYMDTNYIVHNITPHLTLYGTEKCPEFMN